MVDFIELIKNLLVGEEEFIVDFFVNCVLLGVDDVVYIKVGFLVVVVKGEVSLLFVLKEKVVELFGIMLGGYNIVFMIEFLDDEVLVLIVVKGLLNILLMFDVFYDVEEKVKVGNEFVK